MPKKPLRDNRGRSELRTVHKAGAVAERLLQSIIRRGQVVLPHAGAGAKAEEPWLQRLRAALPEELRPHLVRVLEKADGLVLFAGSATWAGRLRLLLPELSQAAGNRKLALRLEVGRRNGE